MSKRGQAAMEFLMTYGWAILAAIIAIGVLAYFGVFSPGKYVGSSAVVTAPFYANAWSLSQASGATLELRNNGGETLNVTSVAYTVTDPSDGSVACTEQTPSANVPSNALISVTLPCPGLSTGDTFKADITISYRKSGSGVTLTSTGTHTQVAA